MTITITHIVVALCLALAAFNAQAAKPVENLWFADSHVSAFYAIDEAEHRVILITEPGPRGQGHPARRIEQLSDGERYTISMDGTGRNALTATLTVTRHGEDMNARITTISRDRFAASPD